MFLGKTLTLIVRLSTQVNKWVMTNLLLGVACDGLASHPRESRNTPSRPPLHSTEAGVSSGLMGQLVRTQTFY